MARAKLLILEGVDVTGKSFYAKQLAKEADSYNLIETPRKAHGNTDEDYGFYNWLQGQIDSTKTNILDRFFVSNLVYEGYKAECGLPSLYNKEYEQDQWFLIKELYTGFDCSVLYHYATTCFDSAEYSLEQYKSINYKYLNLALLDMHKHSSIANIQIKGVAQTWL